MTPELSMAEKPDVFTATCPGGLEALLAEEIASFGGKITRTGPGAVYLEGNRETAYRICLWSRFAHRVLKPLGACSARDENELYRAASSIDWPAHFSPEKTIAVVCKATRSPILNTHYAALRIKDAVADLFTKRFGVRPDVDTGNPDITIHAYLEQDKASFSIDLAGEGLHRRGYRLAGDQAPIRETLAAAVVRLSGWPFRGARKPPPLIDPMCGSGTLLIEAALMALGIAPALGRTRFGFHGWHGHDHVLWKKLRDEAMEKAAAAKAAGPPGITGYDASRHAVATARENIALAGLTGFVHVERRELAHLARPAGRAGNLTGYVVCNPPYGHRLGSRDDIRYLYACLGRKLNHELHGWHAAVLTSDETPANWFGLKTVSAHGLFNGPIPCKLTVFRPAGKPDTAVPLPTVSRTRPGAFADRIRKNLRRLSKWAKREDVTCFRLYDADIPEFNVAVDFYEGRLVVQEYAPPAEIDPDRAAERLRSVTGDLSAMFGVEERDIHIKVRSRQRGKSQYRKKGGEGEFIQVREADCRFLVNLSDYLDTGLFLESRSVRKLLRKWSGKARFLNLFGYTGTANVHAAVAGARHTTLVDISPVYLDWARRNFALNGLAEENHRPVRADCLDWLRSCGDLFELIYIHPPTFSNSRRTGTKFDIRRQHSTLIHMAMRRLAPGGRTIFATSAARFSLDMASLGAFRIRDISRSTLPPDFARSAGRYRCWEFSSAV